MFETGGGHVVGGRGGGDHGHVVLRGQLGNGDGGLGRNVTYQGDYVADQAVVSIYGLGRVALFVVPYHLDLLAQQTAVGIELLYVQVDAALRSDAVYGHVAGQRSQTADADRIAVSRCKHRQGDEHYQSKKQRYHALHKSKTPLTMSVYINGQIPSISDYCTVLMQFAFANQTLYNSA